MGLFKEIRKLFSGWERINSPPDWVSNLFKKKLLRVYKRGGHGYDKPFYFKGKTFLYKCIKTSEVQGGSLKYYRRRRG